MNFLLKSWINIEGEFSGLERKRKNSLYGELE
jgi:hypothetical protein